jgi:hypothetical protein
MGEYMTAMQASTLPIEQRLRAMAKMLILGERIQFGPDATLMREAADELERLKSIVKPFSAVQSMTRPLPAEYLPCYVESIRVCGKLTLSEASAIEILHGYQRSLTYRRTLEQIARNGTNNADLALQARNTLREDPTCSTPRKRLAGIDMVRAKRRQLTEPVGG